MSEETQKNIRRKVNETAKRIVRQELVVRRPLWFRRIVFRFICKRFGHRLEPACYTSMPSVICTRCAYTKRI